MGAMGERFQQTFALQMSKIGTQATMTSRVLGGYDPVTGTASIAEESFTVKGVFDNVTRGKYKDGTTEIRNQTRVFLIPVTDVNNSAISFDPQVKYHVTIGAITYGIETVEQEIADDVTVYNRLYLENA